MKPYSKSVSIDGQVSIKVEYRKFFIPFEKTYYKTKVSRPGFGVWVDEDYKRADAWLCRDLDLWDSMLSVKNCHTKWYSDIR